VRLYRRVLVPSNTLGSGVALVFAEVTSHGVAARLETVQAAGRKVETPWTVGASTPSDRHNQRA